MSVNMGWDRAVYRTRHITGVFTLFVMCSLPLWGQLTPTSASFGGGGGSGSFAVQASPGVQWTATTTAGWLHIQSGAGTGNGTVAYTVDYDFGNAQTGAITVNGNVFTVTEEALVFPPDATYTKTVSITPSQPSGPGPATFTVDVSDPNGANWVGTVQAIFNWSTEGPGSCTVMYQAAGNALFLLDDAADGWLGDAAPGTPNSNVSNSQCTLAISGASVTQSGNDLILGLPITFASSFIGPQRMFSIGQDHWGLSSDDPASENFGAYTAVAAQAQAPTVTLTHTPDGANGTTFTLTASDVNGASYIAKADLALAGIGTDGGSGTECRVSYDRALNQFTLEPEGGTDTAVTWTPGASVTAVRGNCQIDTVHTTAVAVQNTVTLTIPVTAGSGAPASVTAEADAMDHAGVVTTSQETWTLTAGTLSLPVTSALFGGGGGSGSFAVQASPGLAWTASTAAGWLHIQSGSGTGNGTVTYTVDYNFGAGQMANITVNGIDFKVTEAALVFPPDANYTKTVSITPVSPADQGRLRSRWMFRIQMGRTG